MKLIKKNLATVKNKLLLELEDDLLDLMMSQMGAEELTQEQSQQAIVKVMDTIKDKSIRFTQICYTTEDGNEPTEDELKEIPMKIRLFKEAVPEILEIIMGSLEDGEEESGKPKPKGRVGVVRKK